MDAILVASTFNMMITVRVAGILAEATSISLREHPNTEPVLKAESEFSVMEMKAQSRGWNYIKPIPCMANRR